MLERLRRSFPVIPTVLTMVALAVLISLGNWQWQRKAWKDSVVAQLQAAGGSDAIDFDQLGFGPDGRRQQAGAPAVQPRASYTPVILTGEFVHEQELYVFWARNADVGFLVFTPLRTRSGLVVLVNRGFVPERLKSRKARTRGLPGGKVAIRGLLIERGNAAGFFTPPADVGRRTWYAILPADMIAKSSLPQAVGGRVLATHTIEADATPNAGGWPQGRSLKARIADIPNRHLEYALTWWGLAVTLMGVYGVFVFSRLQRPQPSKG